MFATLAGGLPYPPVGPAAGPATGRDTLPSEEVAAAVTLQAELGLEPISDGGLRAGDPIVATCAGLEGPTVGPGGPGGPPTLAHGALPTWSAPFLVDDWRATAALTDRAVKQVVAGPYTLARRVGERGADDADGRERERLAIAFAEALNPELRALAAAGCPLIQVDEPAAVDIGDSPHEARVFLGAQERLLDGLEGVHVSLAITGGNADPAGPATFFDAPFASFLFDLIDGPDNWRLVARAPTGRGIVCGVVPGADQPPVDKEVIVWAAHYAASTMGRGLARVGLATSGSLAGVSWAEARERLELLALAAEIAADPSTEELVRRLDRRAFMRAPLARAREAGGPGAPSDRPRRSGKRAGR